MENNSKVLIIGAGCAGLEAGRILAQKGIPFEIFEATNRIGGRVDQINTWADFPLDLGSDLIFGDKSPHKAMAD